MTWTLFVISIVIGMEEPKVTRYDTFDHFETCIHAQWDLEEEFKMGESTICVPSNEE